MVCYYNVYKKNLRNNARICLKIKLSRPMVFITIAEHFKKKYNKTNLLIHIKFH